MKSCSEVCREKMWFIVKRDGHQHSRAQDQTAALPGQMDWVVPFKPHPADTRGKLTVTTDSSVSEDRSRKLHRLDVIQVGRRGYRRIEHVYALSHRAVCWRHLPGGAHPRQWTVGSVPTGRWQCHQLILQALKKSQQKSSNIVISSTFLTKVGAKSI